MSSLQGLSREDYKRKRELDELRKAGAAPAELDDEGNMINPHIPHYMAEAPWYVSDGRPGIKHLKNSRKRVYAGFDAQAKKGRRTSTAKKFRKGSCENCGAGSHKTRDCCERPRKIKAKHNDKNIKPDEVISEVSNFSYDGKRDHWKNYDLDDHKNIIDFSEKAKTARRKKKEKELDEMLQQKTVDPGLVDRIGDKLGDENVADSGRVIQQMNEIKRHTVRNLRTREDKAKYLQNLSLDSALYDPKTRSMRGNPLAKGSDYLGDNFVRVSGDAVKFREVERFSARVLLRQ